MILGEFSPGLYFQISSITIAVSILVMYKISQDEGHEKPFPYCWISSVADHYPEYILFRFSTIAGSTLVILGWFVNYFYVKSVAFEKVINIRKYHPEVVLILGTMGGMFLMGSTANIDTGRHNSDWHVHCAGLTFVTTILAQVLNTILFWQLLPSKAVNRTQVYLKTFQVILIAIQVYISTTNGFFEKYGQPIEDGDYESVKDIILEWTLTYTMILGFLIMSFDVSKFKMVYEYDSVSDGSLQQPQEDFVVQGVPFERETQEEPSSYAVVGQRS